ncbi:hypothetical protein GGI22_007770 [Coemansia erecta]|nr:hypothetical protein GGI22_007770 [Coemansia erecta]
MAKCFGAPMDGRGWIERSHVARGKRAAAALLGSFVDRIPEPRVRELREIACLAVNMHRDLFPSDIQHDPEECVLLSPPSPCVHDLKALCALPVRERGPDYVSHGEIVVGALTGAARGGGASEMCDSCAGLVGGGVAAFVAAWRAHFLEHARPQRLPDHWDPGYPVYKRRSG